MDSDDRIRRAHAAAGELEYTQDAFVRIRAELIAEWADTAPEATQEREALYFQVTALAEVQKRLKGYLDDALIERKTGELRTLRG